MVTARPPFLSSEQSSVFKQLIEDNPVGYEDVIGKLKSDFPTDLGGVFPTSDTAIDSFSNIDTGKLFSRVEMYKQIAKQEVATVSLTTGDTIILPDPNSNRFFEKVDASMKNYFKMATKSANFNMDLSTELTKLTKSVGNFSQSFIGQISDSLQTGLVSYVQGGLAGVASKIFSSGVKGALGKVTSFQSSLIGPVSKLFEGMECLTSKIGQAMSGVISDMLTGMTKNMLTAPTCATQQFVGALTNKIADAMDSVVSPLLGPIQGAFGPIGSIFNVKDKIMGGIDFMKKVGGLFKCEPPKKQTSSVKYVIDGLLKKDLSSGKHKSLLDGAMNAAATTNSFLQKAEAGLSGFEKAYGKWSIFGSPVDSGGAHESAFTGGNCDTGNSFACGPATVDIFGGDGNGVTGEVILGNFLTRFDKDDIYGSFKKTASILGVNITNPGRGFTEPPLVSFDDKCGQGYGAYGRAIIDTNSKSPTFGQVTSVVMLSEGENYPVDANPTSVDGQFPEVYIDDIIIEDPGEDYIDTPIIDTGHDDIEVQTDTNPDSPNYGRIIAITILKQVPYDVFPDLTVISETGYGAVIRPILSTNKAQPDPDVPETPPEIIEDGKVIIDPALPITDIRGNRVRQVFKVIQCVGTYPEETIKPVSILKPIITDVEEPVDTTPTPDIVESEEDATILSTETETETTQTSTSSSSAPTSSPPPTPPSSPPSGGGGGYGY